MGCFILSLTKGQIDYKQVLPREHANKHKIHRGQNLNILQNVKRLFNLDAMVIDRKLFALVMCLNLGRDKL